MENKFLKISAGVGVLFVGFAVIYYFAIFTPRIEREKYTQQQMEKCAQESQKLYSKIISDVEKEGKDFGVVHENYFNRKLNTCLLSYGYGYDGVVVKYVIDVYTNKMVLTFGMTMGKEWDISYDEFLKKHKELFDE